MRTVFAFARQGEREKDVICHGWLIILKVVRSWQDGERAQASRRALCVAQESGLGKVQSSKRSPGWFRPDLLLNLPFAGLAIVQVGIKINLALLKHDQWLRRLEPKISSWSTDWNWFEAVAIPTLDFPKPLFVLCNVPSYHH